MSLPLVAFPDVELWATGYLRAALAARTEPYAASVFVSIAVPETRRDRMVIVRRDGGPRLDAVREIARMGVDVWGTTEQECSDLTRLVRALLWAAPDGKPVCKAVENSGPSPIPDAQPRRFMTWDLTVRGSDL